MPPMGGIHSDNSARGMHMRKSWRLRLSGAAAGLVNGLFGGGGGVPLALLLQRWVGLEQKTALATCVAAVLPLCAVSAAALLAQGGADVRAAVPYLVGGFFGGQVGAWLFSRVPGAWLRRAFALFLLYGGVRYLL